MEELCEIRIRNFVVYLHNNSDDKAAISVPAWNIVHSRPTNCDFLPFLREGKGYTQCSPLLTMMNISLLKIHHRGTQVVFSIGQTLSRADLGMNMSKTILIVIEASADPSK